jgi:hypothetical protein
MMSFIVTVIYRLENYCNPLNTCRRHLINPPVYDVDRHVSQAGNKETVGVRGIGNGVILLLSVDSTLQGHLTCNKKLKKIALHNVSSLLGEHKRPQWRRTLKAED